MPTSWQIRTLSRKSVQKCIFSLGMTDSNPWWRSHLRTRGSINPCVSTFDTRCTEEKPFSLTHLRVCSAPANGFTRRYPFASSFGFSRELQLLLGTDFLSTRPQSVPNIFVFKRYPFQLRLVQFVRRKRVSASKFCANFLARNTASFQFQSNLLLRKSQVLQHNPDFD